MANAADKHARERLGADVADGRRDRFHRLATAEHGLRDQIRQALTSFLAPGLPVKLTQPRVLVSGDTVYASVDFAIDGDGPDGKPLRIAGTTVDILRRETDGIWRQCLDLPFGTATPYRTERADPGDRRRGT